MVVVLAVAIGFADEVSPWLSVLDRLLFDLTRQATGVVAADLSTQAFSALIQSSGLLQPRWVPLVTNAALVACVGYLVLALPLLGAGMSVLLTILLAMGLLLTQAGLILYLHRWLPLGQTVLFLLMGFVIMLFWLPSHWKIRGLRKDVQQARYQLGKILLQQGRLDEAMEALNDALADEEVLGLQYDIAIQQERKRQYEQARRTYLAIRRKNKGFRDVSKRLTAMERLTGEASPGPGSGFETTRTLVLPDSTISTPTLGRYEIEREVGRGAMGVVYLGRDPKIARRVAIKTLSYSQFDASEFSELKARFYREAEAAGRLNHPAIVTVYDVGEENDLAFIAMDFAEGKPLSAHCKPGMLLPLDTAVDIVARVAEALNYAHAQKIVHRDIKPGNIIFDARSGKLKITDFGIAKITDDSKTRTGSVMGSPLYMSPEQLKGQKVTGASDIYSLGVTLYKLVCGGVPYEGETLASLTYQVLNKRPRSVKTLNPDLPTGVVRVINKAIQKDPAKRYGSAGAMAEALDKVAGRRAGREVVG